MIHSGGCAAQYHPRRRSLGTAFRCAKSRARLPARFVPNPFRGSFTVPTRPAPAGAPAEDESQSRSVAAVERAMDILLYFGRTEQPDLGVTEIASALGLTK